MFPAQYPLYMESCHITCPKASHWVEPWVGICSMSSLHWKPGTSAFQGLPTTASDPVISGSSIGAGREESEGAERSIGRASEKDLPVRTSWAAATRSAGPIRFWVPRWSSSPQRPQLWGPSGW
jgi:hypothetical protein